jgi:hypothetical protein
MNCDTMIRDRKEIERGKKGEIKVQRTKEQKLYDTKRY